MPYKLKIVRDGNVSYMPLMDRQEAQTFASRIEREHEAKVVRLIDRARQNRKGPQTTVSKAPGRPSLKLLKMER